MGGSAIRAVTLDYWGTLLIDPPGSDDRYTRQRLAGFAVILETAGRPTPLPALQQAYEEGGRQIGRVWLTGKDLPVRQHVTTMLDAVDPGLSARLSSAMVEALVQAYSSPALTVPPAVDDGAKSALAALKDRNLTLCVVSNTMRTPGVVLRKILDRYGLLGFFEALTFSDEVGIRKPDPEIFSLTLRKIDVSPEEAVHVGDDWVLDVQGAKAAGMRAIHVTTSVTTAGPGRRGADAVIPSLRELPEALDRLT
jgi:putative hydrolase of the HAD superfamily